MVVNTHDSSGRCQHRNAKYFARMRQSRGRRSQCYAMLAKGADILSGLDTPHRSFPATVSRRMRLAYIRQFPVACLAPLDGRSAQVCNGYLLHKLSCLTRNRAFPVPAACRVIQPARSRLHGHAKAKRERPSGRSRVVEATKEHYLAWRDTMGRQRAGPGSLNLALSER